MPNNQDMSTFILFFSFSVHREHLIIKFFCISVDMEMLTFISYGFLSNSNMSSVM